MKTQKKCLFLPVLFLVAFFCLTTTAFASTWTGGSDDPAQLKDLEVVLSRVIVAFTGLIGFAFLGMLVIGGFKYMTAGDDPKAAQAAQKTLTMAVVGLVLFFSALVITTVLETLTGMDLSVFEITPPTS